MVSGGADEFDRGAEQLGHFGFAPIAFALKAKRLAGGHFVSEESHYFDWFGFFNVVFHKVTP